MFDKEKAAKYFVVAWVKNWRMMTYLGAIEALGTRFEELHDIYPWLPPKQDLHFYIKNAEVRPWMSRSMKVISDKMWDTDDNVKRLALAKHIELWNADKTSETTQHKKDAYQRRQAITKLRQSGQEYTVSVALMRKGRGTDWNTVK